MFINAAPKMSFHNKKINNILGKEKEWATNDTILIFCGVFCPLLRMAMSVDPHFSRASPLDSVRLAFYLFL